MEKGKIPRKIIFLKILDTATLTNTDLIFTYYHYPCTILRAIIYTKGCSDYHSKHEIHRKD